uniref:GntR family transcriptional regulator n=1 Tax=Janibacter limosus TaxID=53458 RepID=A0AC61U0D9_9MICO|nr:GntR family transcriptional regulator [Janibacter limosus]
MVDDWISALESERAAMGRASASEKVADALRTRIIEGELRPRTRLSEERIGGALRVSRNTLREAFQLSAHERLVVREFNRGVFVRELDQDDVRDLYRFRRILEVAAVRATASARPDLGGCTRPSTKGVPPPVTGTGASPGSANMHFHKELTALAGSRRADEAMQQVLAEMRLVFSTMADPRTFHEPYLEGNRELAALPAAGEHDEAERALLAYLERAETQLLAAMSA